MIDNVAVFISQNVERGTFLSRVPSAVVKQHGGMKAVKTTMLQSTEWYAYLGNMPIFDGEPSHNAIKKLHDDWAAAGSPIVIGELHPCNDAPELLQLYEAIRCEITSLLVDAPQGNGSPLGLWMLALNREFVEFIYECALNSPHKVNLTPEFGSLFIQDGKLKEMRDTGLVKLDVFCANGHVHMNLIEAELPALWKRVVGK